MIAVSHRRLTTLVPNAKNLENWIQNLYVGCSQVQRGTFLTKSALRVLTLAVPNMISLRASCHQSHLRKKLDIHSVKRLLLLNVARCIKFNIVGGSSTIFSPVEPTAQHHQRWHRHHLAIPPHPAVAEDGDTRDNVVYSVSRRQETRKTWGTRRK